MTNNINYWKEVAAQMRKDYDPKKHVYTVEFNPDSGSIRAHLEWPVLRDHVTSTGIVPAIELTRVQSMVHVLCKVSDITCVAVVADYELERMLGLEHIEGLERDPVELFKLWRGQTGWARGRLSSEAQDT